LSDETEGFRVVCIEIHEEEVRLPFFELGTATLRVRRDAGDVLAMIEGERNEVCERLIDNDQHARGP
jgi:hypothetical protein